MLLLGMRPSLELYTQRAAVERARKSPRLGASWLLSIPTRHVSFAACNTALMSSLTQIDRSVDWGLITSCSRRKMQDW